MERDDFKKGKPSEVGKRIGRWKNDPGLRTMGRRGGKGEGGTSSMNRGFAEKQKMRK